METFDRYRLSVTLVEVAEGSTDEYQALAGRLASLIVRKKYGIAETIRDEAHPLRFYEVRRWTDAAAAARCHADPEAQAVTAELYRLARVTHLVNGVRPAEPLSAMLDDRRTRAESDRRSGFDRRAVNVGRAEGDRRSGRERRVGPRRRPHGTDLIGAARRAREGAIAGSRPRVGAALETADGQIFTGCNLESAAFGSISCAERAALIKALSEGHRAFARLALVADAETPPCESCRSLMAELCPDIEIRLSSLDGPATSYRLGDLPHRAGGDSQVAPS